VEYRWTLRRKPDESTIQNLTSSLKIPKSLAVVLYGRGVSNHDEALEFFEPSLDNIHDPFLMDGMDIAVDRIIKAVKNNEQIWIHGDYDVDGTASTAIMLQFLREIGAHVHYYIPDRFIEGYGLSINSIKKAKRKGCSLLITVDVGITSYEPLRFAERIGMDALVCDHHEPGDHLPNVLTILDPIKGFCNYPFKHLAACGVAFKLIQGLATRLGFPERAFDYIDYVAVASAADMVPLIGENRTLAYYGLQKLNSEPRPGFKGLIDCTQPGAINTSSIIYNLAPLINAAGRLGDARRSVEMMISKDPVASFRIAQKLEQENRRRRLFDEKTFEESVPIAEELIAKRNSKVLVIHAPNWHAGVIGIVASRLVDRFNLPTVLLTTIDKLAKGSARSIHNFDIHGALKSAQHLLTEFGGHKHAAGLSMKEKHIDEFRDILEDYANNQISNEMLVPEILIDAELKLYELSPQFLSVLNKFAPYGYDNYKPIFFSRGVTAANGCRIVGKNHLKFRAYQSFEIDAIGYNLGHKIDVCQSGKPFQIVYNIEENTFNGHTTPQLRIKDIRPDED
jgi:single-stranded-DNA-specific exonuclease